MNIQEMKQSIFDRAIGHFNAQKRQSLNDDGECAYRGSDGGKCIIGFFIPNDKYQSSMEGRRVFYVARNISDVPEFSVAYMRLLNELQYAHDNAQCAASLNTALQCTARAHNLTLPSENPVKEWERRTC